MDARTRWLLVALALVVALLLAWTVNEARRQSRAVEASLTQQAEVLARALGPGLAAASHAARELEEMRSWRLLDNARLFAELGATTLTAERMESLARDAGLDSVAFYDRAGRRLLSTAEAPPAGIEARLTEVLAGRVDELVLGASVDDGVEHFSAAAALRSGGSVLVRIHVSSGEVFSRQLGVSNLLAHLVGTPGVLYLSHREEPGGAPTEAAWDGDALPPPAAGLRTVRGRPVYEAEIALESPAGRASRLRVGLDASRLRLASRDALRRSLLVGVVLVGFVVAAAALALLQHQRTVETEATRRRLGELELARQRSERLAAAGALAAGLAHEVRNPLNAIGLAAQRLERSLGADDERLAIAVRVAQGVRRLESVLRSFLELASPVSEQRQPTALGELAAEVVELMRDEAAGRQVELRVEQVDLETVVDRDAVHRALVNLVRNAVLASPPGGEVMLRLERERGVAVVRVLDRGSGIPEELLPRVFDPFVTSRVEGTGLGLPLARRVAEEHGGSLSVANRAGGGVEATLRLPAVEGPTA
jgi:signal transduction histidine kinase